MQPYLSINSEEWSHIKNTFDREDVKESLAQVCMEYELPYAEITETDSGKYLLRCGKGRDNHNRKGREFYSAPSSVELALWENK
jgi:hypothetical protein